MQASSQQQQQSQSATTQAAKTVAKTQDGTQNALLCPKCNSEVPEDAACCPECGNPVKQRVCPKCGFENMLNEDICRACKTWLLEGQCIFCYAKLGDDAGFCPECGKPQVGIPCPNCGNLSTFDFCSKCGNPVTEEAVAELQAVQANAPPPVNTQIAAMEAELAELETFISSEPEPEIEPEIEEYIDEDEPEVVVEEPVRKSLFSERQIASITQAGADIDRANQQRAEEARIAEEKRQEAEAKRKAADEKRKEAAARQKAANAKKAADEAERQQQIQEAQNKKAALQKTLDQNRAAAIARRAAAMEAVKQNAYKTFSDNNAARIWHAARRHPDSIGWLCNAFGNVHLYKDGGLNECSCPQNGGCDYFGRIVKCSDGFYKPG
jgi:chemotaxis protein histidine kinase CheA